MQVKCEFRYFLKFLNFFQKTLAFSPDIVYYKRVRFVGQEAKTSPSHGENRGSIPLRTAEGSQDAFSLKKSCFKRHGSLVKRLRRRPLTAKTGVRFPYELLKVSQNPFSLKILFYIIRFVGQEAKTSPSHGENRGSIPLRTVEGFTEFLLF